MSESERDRAVHLRRAAEARVAGGETAGGEAAAESPGQLLQELQVHQIELEIQNEELRSAQQELTRSREQFFRLFNNAPVGYVVLDRVGVIQQANRTMGDLVGCDEHTLTGRPLAEFLTIDSRHDWLSRFPAIFHSPAGKSLEGVLADHHGRALDVRFEAAALHLPRADGDVRPEYLLLVTVSNITEQKRVDRALRDSELRHRRLFEEAAVGIFEASPEGRLLVVNPALARMLGVATPDAVVTSARGVQEWIGFEPRARIKAIEDGSSGVFESRGQRADGSPWDARVHLRLLPTGGDSEKLAGFVEDITVHKALEEQLIEAHKLETVGRLAGGVAHDFNNMLSVILGRVDLALGEVAGTSSVAEHLAEIRRSAERSARLTHQLLAFARKQLVRPRSLTLNAVITDNVEMLGRVLGADITLRLDLDPGVWTVMIDPGQVEQVIVNLAMNARDAIGQSGTVTIRTANVPRAHRSPGLPSGIPAGDCVCLTVRDDGAGMSRQTLEHVFEPFFTTKAFGAGSGLGLPTVYGIVRQNHGWVHIDSQPGAGTAVAIYLPRHNTASLPAHQDATTHADLRGSETILVVEDEDQLLRVVERVLKLHGYRVIPAQNPVDAITIFERYHDAVDLLLTDVVMPGLNGRQLRDRLMARRPDLKCLYVSGYDADIVARHGVVRDDAQFLSKPFDTRTLLERVRTVLES